MIFDTATGRRIYRGVADRLRAQRHDVAARGLEIAGVALVALAAAMWIAPLGLAVGGLYLIWLAASD